MRRIWVTASLAFLAALLLAPASSASPLRHVEHSNAAPSTITAAQCMNGGGHVHPTSYFGGICIGGAFDGQEVYM